MPCKCDPAKKRRGECTCNESLPHPGGSPQRALNKKKCPRIETCGTGLPDDRKWRKSSTIRVEDYYPNLDAISRKRSDGEPSTSVLGSEGNRKPCVSLESGKRAPCAKFLGPRPYRRTCQAMDPEPVEEPPPCMREEPRTRKPLKKKRQSDTKNVCRPGRVVKTSCGMPGEDGTLAGLPAKIFALEKTLSKTQWQDAEGYHSASVTMSQLYRPSDQEPGSGSGTTKSCGSEKRRNYLRAKLRQLMGESRPIPEGAFPEGCEAKPEPEVVAAALLMSEGESNDLGKTRPDNIFHQLFSSSSPDRSVALASAGPEPMNEMVVPLTVEGQKPASLDMPNPERMVEKTRGAAAPSPSVFHDSDTFDEFSERLRDDFAGRSPAVADVSGFLGAPLAHSSLREIQDDGILEYVIRPEPPVYRNRVRLNGSVRPGWFPGYTVVSPLVPGCVRLSQNPGDALRDAWCLCRPRHFDQLSKSLVNTG